MMASNLVASLAPLESVGGRGSTPYLLVLCSPLHLDRVCPAMVVLVAEADSLVRRGAVIPTAGSALRILAWARVRAQLDREGKLKYGGGRRRGCTSLAKA